MDKYNVTYTIFGRHRSVPMFLDPQCKDIESELIRKVAKDCNAKFEDVRDFTFRKVSRKFAR